MHFLCPRKVANVTGAQYPMTFLFFLTFYFHMSPDICLVRDFDPSKIRYQSIKVLIKCTKNRLLGLLLRQRIKTYVFLQIAANDSLKKLQYKALHLFLLLQKSLNNRCLQNLGLYQLYSFLSCVFMLKELL